MYHTSCFPEQSMKQDAKVEAKPARTSSSRPFAPVAGRHNQRLKELRLHSARRNRLCAVNVPSKASNCWRKRCAAAAIESVFFSESARPLAENFAPDQRMHRNAHLAECTLQLIRAQRRAQAVAALLKMPVSSVALLLDRANDGPLLVAAGLQDPGNLGTLLRSAEAFGAAGLFFTEGTVSPYNWKVLRASAGSIFRLPFPADFFRGTDSDAARKRRSPARNLVAPWNSLAPSLVEAAACHIHRQ